MWIREDFIPEVKIDHGRVLSSALADDLWSFETQGVPFRYVLYGYIVDINHF